MSHLQDADISVCLAITSTDGADLTGAEEWAAEGVEGSGQERGRQTAWQ